jgi:hypothetical protein
MVFLEELTARLNAETAIKKKAEAELEKKRKKDEVLTQLRIANQKNIGLLMKH